MTRRLVVAFVATVLTALVLAGLGTFVLSARAARITTERELRKQAIALSDAAAGADQPIVLRALTNLAIQRVLRIDGSSFVRVEATGQIAGTLPAGVTKADLVPLGATQPVTSGRVTSGRHGRVIYAAARSDVAAGGRIVAVLTQRSSNGLGAALSWFLLASGMVLALAVLSAVVLGQRLTRPVREVEAAARRIAAGELSTRLTTPPVHHQDEVADLIRSINTMAASLERSKTVEQQFLMSVSHDLRTPLTSIRGYAEAIDDGTIRDPKPAARVILNESRRLERLVRDLLDLAKLQARSFSFHPERVDLAQVAVAAANSFSSDGEGPTVTADTAHGALVWADRDRLDQVVANLVENARKFANHRVVIGARLIDATAMLWVDDDGPGILPEDRPHVFERLYVSKERPARTEAGSGLGLAIVTELVAAMGGTVGAEASPNGGARMVVRLPVLDRLADHGRVAG